MKWILLFALIILFVPIKASSERPEFCLDSRTGQIMPCQYATSPSNHPVRSCKQYEEALSKLKSDFYFAGSFGPRRNQVKERIDRELIGYEKYCQEDYAKFCEDNKELCQ